MGCYETVPESGSLLAFLIVTICKLRRTHPLQAETLVALNTYHVNPHYLSCAIDLHC
jgi:hypothetical protein